MTSLSHVAFLRSGTFFFTVRLKNEGEDLLIAHFHALRKSFCACRRRMPFELGASVVLPDRLHLIWTMPQGDVAYGPRWRMIKAGFTARIKDNLQQGGAKGRLSIWQRRYWEQPITGPEDLALYEDLIRNAPVQHGLVKRPEMWRHSSFAARPLLNQPWSQTLAG